MLFNSYEFLFIFLPIVVAVFYAIGSRDHHRIAIAWLVGASLFFYGWWNPAYVALIIGSILFNYAIGGVLGNGQGAISKWVLGFGVGANLALLGYFKYSNFFIDNVNVAFDAQVQMETIVLPLAISFFTFQQIIYLVDAYQGVAREYNFLHYCLFVTFFPQLIAGPIVHHKEMLPQFADNRVYRLNLENIAVGLTILTIGLVKKVALADSMAEYATPVFGAAENGAQLAFIEGWIGALAYTFQLYFDFSGYSDMAIGLGRIFGIRLPLNFNSPYKATSIIDFWRRWHITLARFLRDYLYIPLGGNRKGTFRRYVNLFVTMLLGGLWHGAGWTFVIWGALHGCYLMVNHGWRALMRFLGIPGSGEGRCSRLAAQFLTFLAVVVAWVFFRAENIDGALAMLYGMSGVNGVILPERLHNIVIIEGNLIQPIVWITVLFLITWFAPSTQQIMKSQFVTFDLYKGIVATLRLSVLQWQPTRAWAIATALLLATAIFYMQRESEFIYFQF